MGVSTALLLRGALILVCSQLTAASHYDLDEFDQSPASPFDLRIRKCFPSLPCRLSGGYCVVTLNGCPNGELRRGQCKCKGRRRRGHCCIPPVTTAESSTSASSHSWGYTGEYDPEHWSELYETCGGSNQSPIEISRATLGSATPAMSVDDPWVFNNYDVPPTNITITNNGHSAAITWNSDSAPSVEGGFLGAEYTLDGFHFHWGSDSAKGSEHVVLVPSPLEMHLVHYKTEYGDLSTAVNYDDGLVVLAVFFDLDSAVNPNLSPITDFLTSVEEAETETTTAFSLPLSFLLPSDTSSYIRYSGSLTTPSCDEVVTWTLFNRHKTISAHQLNSFRSLKFEDGTPLVDNFRPTQPLNGREIQFVY